MRRIFLIAVLVAAIPLSSTIFSKTYLQSSMLAKMLTDKAEELLQNANYLREQTSSFLTSPAWNEKRLLDKMNEFKENSEELFRFSRDYYRYENEIFNTLGDLTSQIQEIIDLLKQHTTLRILVRDAYRCLELISEYKQLILRTLSAELEEQTRDFRSEIEYWVDEEQPDQQKLTDDVRLFEQNCQKIYREISSYYFNLDRVKNSIFQLYDFSSQLNRDLKKQKISTSIERKWDICLRLVENLKNTIQTLESSSLREIEAEKKANYPPVGYLDIASREEIAGWAFDIDAGVKPVDVHIYINEQHVATVSANEKRDDLVGKVPGLKEPYHGFSWKPKNIPPGRFLVKVYAINAPQGDNPLLGQKIIY